MPQYTYTAKNFQGETKTGELEAANVADVAQQLHKDGFVLTFAEETAKQAAGRKFAFLDTILNVLNRVKLSDKMVFSRNLAILVGAGVSLNRALEILAKETENERFKEIILTVAERVRGGKPFSEALEEFPGVFEEIYTSMVRVGETGGNLEEVLKLLAVHYEKEHDLRSKVQGAMVYPAVIVCVMIGVGFVVMAFVIPKLTQVFVEMNVELPLSTKVIIVVSNILAQYSVFVIAAAAVFIYLLRVFSQKEAGKKIFHKLFLNAPILKNISKKVNAARMTRILSALIDSGVPMVKALEISAHTLANWYFKQSLLDTSVEVQKGVALSKLLAKYPDLYPGLVTQMIEVGEESGKLSEILVKVADFYEDEVANITRNLASIIEPVLMVVIGVAVGFFAVSIIQPLYSIVSQAG
jgi:type IV pilus assembly protein PilC